jgi:hypothetical protein
VNERVREIRVSEWLLGGALALAFLPALIAMAEIWTSVDYYSHGFLVPLVAYWAATRSRVRFAILEDRDRRAVIAVIAGVLLYAMGLASGSVSLQGLALVAVVASGAFYLGGSRGMRVLAFPLAFLVFMVPLPQSWLTPMIVKLQLMVAAATSSNCPLAIRSSSPKRAAGSLRWSRSRRSRSCSPTSRRIRWRAV